MVCDRLTPEELIEILGVSVEDVFDRYREECMKINWDEVFE
jgi:hypothetical protein